MESLYNLTKAVATRPYYTEPCIYDALAIFKSRTGNYADSSAQVAPKGQSYKSISREHYLEMWIKFLQCFKGISEK
eukprot:CAMPEP_0184022464 /NCGR_PEP_ID=MMETSP0954-20121128/10623_1 /TAXON_ID=627963 /ORGANISM="Aplanochytrium sp, Strain PBS07" /LENGTH=75 /DNA_ID=CAMNT_0026304847 /DNA_START=137 /DNA_END=364 /DNA_ORIENTATION=+